MQLLIEGYYIICVGVSLDNVLLTFEAFTFLSRGIRTSHFRKSVGICHFSLNLRLMLECSLNLGAGAGTCFKFVDFVT